MPGPADGALQLRALGLRLKVLSAAGDVAPAVGLGAGRSLRAQLTAGIREAAKPAVEATRQAARSSLPKRGGLNVYVADEQIKTAVRLTGPRVGVRIAAQSRSWNEDQSAVRHPVFGHRDRKWATTKVTPGWFTETLTREAPMIIGAVLAAMEAVAVETTRRL